VKGLYTIVKVPVEDQQSHVYGNKIWS